MRALIITAHGSRRPQSNQEVEQLAARFRGLPGLPFQQVEAAFLELADPLIPEAVGRCIEAGSREVIIYPYFLNSGKHVERDIPDIVARLREQYPHCDIRLLDHFGGGEGIIPLMATHIDQQLYSQAPGDDEEN